MKANITCSEKETFYNIEDLVRCNVKTAKGAWRAFFNLNIRDELVINGCRVWEDLDGTKHVYGPGKYEKEIPVDTVKISLELQEEILLYLEEEL